MSSEHELVPPINFSDNGSLLVSLSWSEWVWFGERLKFELQDFGVYLEQTKLAPPKEEFLIGYFVSVIYQ